MKNKYSYGGGQNTYKVNYLFKDVKEYNKYLLLLIGVFVLLLTGIISYNYTNTSYAKWSSSIESKNIIKLHVESNLDESGANEPKITSNMIPVYYDETNSVWRKADVKNSKEQYKWYDYNNKMWANAVTTFPYEEKVTDTIKKNINVMPYSLTSESSSNASTSVNSQYKMSFTTTKASTFSFDYSMLKGTKTSKFQVTINDTTEVNKDFSGNYTDSVFEGTYTDSFSKNLEANKKYTVIINAEVTSSNASADNSIKVSNIKLTNEYTDFSYENSGSKFTVSYYRSRSYALDQVTGKYVLNLVSTSSEYLKDSYICPNTTSNICDEIYKIIDITYGYMWSAEVTDATINSYVSYTSKNIENEFSKKEIGEEIPLDKISTMWVWIPRYTYTYLNTNTPEEIKIKFEKGTTSSGTIKCVNNVTGTGTTSETCTDTINGNLKAGTSTYTHPAFTFGEDELTGIWVGKFTNSSYIIEKSNEMVENNIIIKPNKTFLKLSASEAFKTIRTMEKTNNMYKFNQKNDTMFNWNGELSYDSNNIDTHMMKNMEWGAVAYFSHSKYGRCTNSICEEITINNCTEAITGIGGNTVDANYSSSACTTTENKYNGSKGKKASTTGNIYGIYDMSGSDTLVMSNVMNSSNQFQTSKAGNWNTTTYPSAKYYDNYSNGYSDNTYQRGKLGDATVEMAPTGTSGNWYSDYANFPYYTNSWFIRGESYVSNSKAGIFAFNSGDGNDKTSRSILAIK